MITKVHLYFLNESQFRFHTLTLNIKMRILYLIFLIHASLQLRCDKKVITAHLGGEFTLSCTFDTTKFLFNKKYWCRGDARESCKILVHSERVAKAEDKFIIIDMRRGGLFVKVSHLKFEDAGKYWVGIDKIYADIMTSVNVIITEVPVSKPTLWPLSPLVDRPTCWGQQVTVRCGCAKGTGIRYTWYQNTQNEDHVLHNTPDLSLHCGTMEEDSQYFCIATNDISSQKSDRLSVHVLMHADSSCIYVIHMQGQPIYDCSDRMSTSTTITPPPLTSCKATTTFPPDIRNQPSQTNQTGQHFLFSTSWSGLPLWYTMLRWGAFASLLIVLGIVLRFIKSQQNIKRARRKRRVHLRRMPYLAQ
ncbi:uncharacterized protein LOC121187116 isoform X1 [Scomber scombrus]|uniref:Uncharacterized protein LOC121187116 isoform X1 n=1 Tax=Scomber scombrus TaxID=13677 RepID=A0AAV1NW06_SCOSC